jgi:hypothetical protein
MWRDVKATCAPSKGIHIISVSASICRPRESYNTSSFVRFPNRTA